MKTAVILSPVPELAPALLVAPAPGVLKLMTDWKGQCRGLRDISRKLNRLKIRTPQGKRWYASTARSQLV